MDENEKLIQNLQNKVKQSQTTLDGGTLGQLRASRQTAIESLTNKADPWWHFTVPQIVLTSVLVITLTTAIYYPMNFNQNEQYNLDVIAVSEDLELLEQLDFYFWIADTVEYES